MKPIKRIQLSIMMFLNFFVWGIWFVTMGTYLGTSAVDKGATLGASDTEIASAYGTQAWGAIIAPFVIGLIADRFFSAQIILGILHLIGAALLYFVSLQTNFADFYPYLLAYMIIYMPTLALVNAISFKQMNNPEKEFSLIRIWGTIGWIAAGLLIDLGLHLRDNNQLNTTFTIASFVSLILGLTSFTLPNTPPPKKGTTIKFSELIGLDAFQLFKDRNFLIFFIASFLISIPLAFYYQRAESFLGEINFSNPASNMTLGQISETLFLFLMPFFFVRLGIKKMLLIGMAAWTVRYLFFSYGDVQNGLWMIYAGIVLHGICYDFFFMTGQIYTDQLAGEKIRSSAQGLITLATYGVGMLIGFWFAGYIADYYKTGPKAHDWSNIWLIPSIIAAAILILFALLFKDPTKKLFGNTTAKE